MSNQHVLKIHPVPLADLLSGAKTAEVRRNDRGFQVGDTVRLMEVNPETGNWTGAADQVCTITHIQTGYGLPDGLCVLSYAQAEQQEAKPVAVEAQRAPAGEFQREDRYLVIKRKDLDLLSPTDRDLALTLMGELSAIMATWNAPKRQYLVVEGDWPEFEPTWAAIQDRVEGRAALATQPAAGEPIGKVELFGINMTYVEWRERKMPPLGTELYAAPPAAAHGDDTRRIDWLACTWRLGGKLPDVDHGSFREVIDAAMRAQGDGEDKP